MGPPFSARLVVLTGAPGTGKSAILDRLRGGLRCVDEPAREVIAEQRASGGRGTWEQDASLFVHLLLERSIEKYNAARGSGETVLFDRGIPDCVVYAALAGMDPEPFVDAATSLAMRPRCSSSKHGAISIRGMWSERCRSMRRGPSERPCETYTHGLAIR